MSEEQNVVVRTAAQKVKGQPLDPVGWGEMVKPGELIDIVELSALTLADRRAYNALIAHAWPQITKPVVHRIEKSVLKGTHYGNERIENTINKLMGTIAIVSMKKNGKRIQRRVQLLGPNDMEEEEKGFIYYRFPEELVEIMTESDIYARLKSHIMFCFESKYSLCLYEMVEKRKGLEFMQSETFTLQEIREFLNVPKGKLERFADLNKYALKVAVQEVNALCEFWVELEPKKQGRKVTHIKMHWFPKSPEGKRDAMAEVDRHRAGRKARVAGTVERLDVV